MNEPLYIQTITDEQLDRMIARRTELFKNCDPCHADALEYHLKRAVDEKSRRAGSNE